MRRILPLCAMSLFALSVLTLALLPVAASAAERQHVAIRAYINVSSGCQAATVDFLNGLKARYAPNVSLEMIDFGDQGRGLKRWQQSGNRCLTIELNGSSLVKFPYRRHLVAVGFRMPAGFNWTHADLEHAVQAGVRGELRPATEADVAAAARPVKLNVAVTTGRTRARGVSCATVLLNGNQALLIPAGASASAAAKRASLAARALRQWLAKPVKPSALTVAPSAGGWKVLAGGSKIITATAQDGKAMGQSPQAVAEMWLSGLKHGLAVRAAQ